VALLDSTPRGPWIGGRAIAASNGGELELVDPSTEERFDAIACGGVAEINLAVETAFDALPGWRAQLPSDRARVLQSAAAALRAAKAELAPVSARDAGLPMRLACADVENAARYFEFYAGACDKLHGESIPLGPRWIDFTLREPYGVCGVIVPFNVPVQMLARSVAPALAAGNVVVAKPAEQAPLSALVAARLIEGAGVPAGVLNVVPGLGGVAGQRLTEHPEVRHLTFTGSEETGRRVLEAAARNIIPVTVELGGKSPHIVFADADHDAAIEAIVGSALRTAGQVCSAGTRILIEESAYEEFAERLSTRAADLSIGRAVEDPDVGPVVSEQQRQGILDAIAHGEQTGISVRYRPPKDALPPRGFFVGPTLLDRVPPNAVVAQQEIFGPLLALTSFSDVEDAIEIANATPYGLVAGVWTRHLDRAMRVALGVDAGQIFINNYGVGGGVELPFGGYKRSGYGREKGLAALLEYTQLKNVCASVAA
jgi:acyl-CoA reductase-like NAD-dependent aldehyde dehydrogenase